MKGLFEIRADIPRNLSLAVGTGTVLLVLIIWLLRTATQPKEMELFLPSIGSVIKAFQELHQDQNLIGNAIFSILRIACGMALSAVLAVPLGLLMGSFKILDSALSPLTGPMRYMPITAFIPLLIIWAGIGEKMKILFLFIGIFFYLLPMVIDITRNVREELLQTAYTLGASKLQVFTSVLIPAAMPEIFDAFRVMNGIGWTYVIVAEIVNPDRGLGYMIYIAEKFLKTDQVFAGIIIIGVIAVLSDLLIARFNRWLFSWRY